MRTDFLWLPLMKSVFATSNGVLYNREFLFVLLHYIPWTKFFSRSPVFLILLTIWLTHFMIWKTEYLAETGWCLCLLTHLIVIPVALNKISCRENYYRTLGHKVLTVSIFATMSMMMLFTITIDADDTITYSLYCLTITADINVQGVKCDLFIYFRYVIHQKPDF